MNLARLAAYRRQTEDILRLELAAAARLLQEAAERAVALEAEVATKQRGYAQAGRSGVTATEVQDWYSDIEQAAERVSRAVAAHAALHSEWARKQTELVEAMQERKKLDILLRRRREARLREQAQEDQRLMDEQAARRRTALQTAAMTARAPGPKDDQGRGANAE